MTSADPAAGTAGHDDTADDPVGGIAPAEDGYDGPAELLVGAVAIPVAVRLRGHFDPISGSYSWYGRVAASPLVAELIEAATRKVMLRTPHAEVPTTLSDIDPWGRPRVEGFGTAPFRVLAALPPVRD